MALVGAALLAGCGGGDKGPAVSSLTANPAMYGRTVSVVVTGSGLDSTVTAVIEPGCPTMTRATTGTDTTQSYSCRIGVLGDLRVRVRNSGGEELAALRLNIETPQVRFTAVQGVYAGDFVVELDPIKAPKSVDNFLAYVNQSPCYLRETLFHRVIANKIVQAGGFKSGFQPVTNQRAAIELESNNGLKNLRGTIAMARTDEPNSATSQFYINVADNPEFDYVDAAHPGYAVFGSVVGGMEHLDLLQAVPTTTKTATVGEQVLTFADTPVSPVTITACSQIR